MSKRSSTGKTASGTQDEMDNSKEVKEKEAKKFKMGIAGISTATSNVKKGIQIKLSSQKQKSNVLPQLKNPSTSVASVFGDDSDDEPEEMPPEARMRMRNIGRDTPTSAGPNSFGKTKQGFCNVKKVFEKTLKDAANEVSGDHGFKK